MDGRLTGLILAESDDAGFKSKTPKILHSVLGLSLLRMTADVRSGGRSGAGPSSRPEFLVESAEAAMAGYPAKVVGLSAGKGLAAFVQVLRKECAGNPDGDVLIVPADVPAVVPALLRDLVARHRRRGYACTMLWADIGSPGYAQKPTMARSVEDGKSVPTVTHPHRVPTGIFVFRAEDLLKFLSRAAKAGPAGRFDPAAAFSLLASSKTPDGGFPGPRTRRRPPDQHPLRSGACGRAAPLAEDQSPGRIGRHRSEPVFDLDRLGRRHRSRNGRLPGGGHRRADRDRPELPDLPERPHFPLDDRGRCPCSRLDRHRRGHPGKRCPDRTLRPRSDANGSPVGLARR